MVMYEELYSKLKRIDFDIFSTIDINIEILGITNGDSEDIYRIKNVSVSSNLGNKTSKSISKFIQKIDSEINNEENSGFKSSDNGWSIFYLLKEIISFFVHQGYQYYRGQSSDWKTIPSIFRRMSNAKGDKYYLDFENMYKEIQRNFPSTLKYVPLDKTSRDKINDRAEQLALLQHYGLGTSLLDITSNPYIAMLFMVSNKMRTPKLELFNIINDCELFTLVKSSEINKRISAQKGAFFNYDLLFLENEGSKDIGKIKIPRVAIRLKYLEDETKKSITSDDMEIERVKKEGGMSQEFQKLLETGEDFVNEERVFDSVRNHLEDKLREYGYYYENLFPDFVDQIKYKSNLYVSDEAE